GFAGALEIVNECFDYDFVDNSARAPSRIIADPEPCTVPVKIRGKILRVSGKNGSDAMVANVIVRLVSDIFEESGVSGRSMRDDSKNLRLLTKPLPAAAAALLSLKRDLPEVGAWFERFLANHRPAALNKDVRPEPSNTDVG